jgi:lambda repressor-like predicted transcriptional regulator
MHPEDIKAALRKKYRTVRAFEEAEGLPQGSVRDVLRGRSAMITAKAIAKALDKTVKSLFPGRFRYQGRNNTSQKRDLHHLNDGAF